MRDDDPVVPGPALLFCPGDRPERFAKAVAAADGVVLDLEDAVGPGAKAAARAHVAGALAQFARTALVVRVNAAGTPWHDDDLAALADAPGVVVMLPMAQSAAAVEALAPRRVIALCETARGILAAPEIAAAANCVGVMWGSEDLVADLGGRRGRAPGGGYRPALEHGRTRVLYAARAAGVVPIDAVVPDIDDLDTLRADSTAAAAAGFAVKACIHPRQVPVVRRAFAPSPEEVGWAEEVVDAAGSASGVFTLRGRMVDEPVLAQARAVLRRSATAVEEAPVDPA